MSQEITRDWLQSFQSQVESKSTFQKAKTISFTSGKGGVGKTSASLKFAQLLALKGYRTLLIDCDYNLSNTAVKLGLPINNSFFTMAITGKSFDEVLHKDGNFHLLPACNGSYEIFDQNFDWDKIIIDIISSHEADYDYIILDSSAGLNKSSLTLSAYCDYRFFVVTPDKSSITDSYSLIKILKQRYGISENHLLLNKVSSKKQYCRLVKTLTDTVDQFLSARLNILGGIPLMSGSVDEFDRELLNIAGSKIESSFSKIVEKFTEENIGTFVSLSAANSVKTTVSGFEQEVQSSI